MGQPAVQRIRASSFGGLFDCAYRWEGVHVLGLVSWNGPFSLMGSGLHAGSALYDRGRVEHFKVTLDDAVGAALDEVRDRIQNEPTRFLPDEPNQRAVETAVMRMTHTYCTKVSPHYTFEAVELTCKPLDIAVNDQLTIQLTGQLDRARIATAVHPETVGPGQLWDVPPPGSLVAPKRRMVDLKSGKRAVSRGRAHTKKHKAQLGTYELLYQHTTGLEINDGSEILGINNSGSHEVGTGRIHGAKALLLGSDEAPGLIEHAGHMLTSGLFPPNPQSSLCSKRYCPRHPTCPYADSTDDE